MDNLKQTAVQKLLETLKKADDLQTLREKELNNQTLNYLDNIQKEIDDICSQQTLTREQELELVR